MQQLKILLLVAATLLNNFTLSHPARIQHYGNYKEMTNPKFQRGCPQLSPNYNDEHCMTYEEFLKTSFFACGHRYNKASSIPSDYNIMGTYSHWRLTCDPYKKDFLGRIMKDRRNKANYQGLVEAGKACADKAKTRCYSDKEKEQMRMATTATP